MPDDGVGHRAEPVGGEPTGAVRGHHDEVGADPIGEIGHQACGAPVLGDRRDADPPLTGDLGGERGHISRGPLPDRLIGGEHLLREERAFRGRTDHGDRDVGSDQMDGAPGTSGQFAGH